MQMNRITTRFDSGEEANNFFVKTTNTVNQKPIIEREEIKEEEMIVEKEDEMPSVQTDASLEVQKEQVTQVAEIDQQIIEKEH